MAGTVSGLMYQHCRFLLLVAYTAALGCSGSAVHPCVSLSRCLSWCQVTAVVTPQPDWPPAAVVAAHTTSHFAHALSAVAVLVYGHGLQSAVRALSPRRRHAACRTALARWVAYTLPETDRQAESWMCMPRWSSMPQVCAGSTSHLMLGCCQHVTLPAGLLAARHTSCWAAGSTCTLHAVAGWQHVTLHAGLLAARYTSCWAAGSN